MAAKKKPVKLAPKVKDPQAKRIEELQKETSAFYYNLIKKTQGC